MNLKENRPLAFIVLAVAVIFSISVLGPLSLVNHRTDAEALFANGDVHEQIQRCAEQSALLGQMSEMYLSDAVLPAEDVSSVLRSNGYTALPATLKALSAELNAAGSPTAAFDVLTELNAAVEQAYTGLEMLSAVSVPEESFRSIKLCYYDYKGALDILSRDADTKDSYTARAEKFNKQLKHFPASLIGGILGVEPLATYGG